MDRTSGQQMQNIVATYDLPVEDAEAALPEGERTLCSSVRICPI